MITRTARIKFGHRTVDDPRYTPDNRLLPFPYDPETDESIPVPHGMMVQEFLNDACTLARVDLYESDQECEQA